MKQLKFAESLPELIKTGKKDTTWRLHNKKDINQKDELSLCDNNGEEFAKAEVLWVKKTTFEALTEQDIEGHEPFPSTHAMYETYKKYYKQAVGPKTELYIIKFKLLSAQ